MAQVPMVTVTRLTSVVYHIPASTYLTDDETPMTEAQIKAYEESFKGSDAFDMLCDSVSIADEDKITHSTSVQFTMMDESAATA